MTTTLSQLNFSTRTSNCLNKANITTIADLTAKTQADLLKIRSLGRISLNEIITKLTSIGLQLTPQSKRTTPTAREQTVLSMSATGNYTLKQMGEALKVTKERIRQILKKHGLLNKRKSKVKPTKPCKHCNTTTTNTIYCSQKCSSQARRQHPPTILLTCTGCKTVFQRTTAVHQITKWSKKHKGRRIDNDNSFCSQKCYLEYKGKKHQAFGENKKLTNWCKDPRCQVPLKVLYRRIRTGWDLEKALTTPHQKRNKKKCLGIT